MNTQANTQGRGLIKCFECGQLKSVYNGHNTSEGYHCEKCHKKTEKLELSKPAPAKATCNICWEEQPIKKMHVIFNDAELRRDYFCKKCLDYGAKV